MTSADMGSQQFWGEFMRRPDAKRAQEAEKRLSEKKQHWLEERQAIEERGERRKQVADALDECPADVKKLIAPMFHIRIVEQFLWEVYEECVKSFEQTLKELRTETFGAYFGKRLKDERTMSELLHFRTNFQEGGEARMEDLERQMYAINREIALDEEKKRELVPAPVDMHTLKELLEFGQQCRYEGNAKFKEGLYEEALEIYAQGDEAMKKWKVEKHLKNEHKWLTDNHIACLNNKAQAALRLELFQTALEASEAALKLDDEDHKAWYRKVQAQKGLGKFKDAETSLTKLEDVAQWCPDRRRILRDCETERKKIKYQRAKHKEDTKAMLGKAFEAGLFSIDRERELEEATKSLEAPAKPTPPKLEEASKKEPLKIEAQKPLKREIHLTAALAGDLMDELADAYKQKWFQERVRKCARDSGFERSVFLMRLKDIAFDVQKPVLEKWGFEGNEHGVREMTAAIRDHAQNGQDMPDWLKQKQDRCLELLYGGKAGGMLEILTQ